MRIFLSGCAAVFLVACTGAGVSEVKELPYSADSSYTVGQVFDNRKDCDAVEWSAKTDERDRQIVEFSCTLSGAQEFFATEIDYQINLIGNARRAEESQVDSVERSLAARIAQLREQAAVGVYVDMDESERIARLKELQAKLKDGSVTHNDLLAFKDWRWKASWFPRLLDASENRSFFQNEMDGHSTDEGKEFIRPQLESADAMFRTTAAVAIEELDRLLDPAAQGASTDPYIASTLAEIETVKAELEAHAPVKAAAFAEIEAREQQRIQELQARYTGAHAIETFQWALTQTGPQLVYGGFEVKNAEGVSLRAIPYRGTDLNWRLKKILEGGDTGIPEFMKFRPTSL